MARILRWLTFAWTAESVETNYYFSESRLFSETTYFGE